MGGVTELGACEAPSPSVGTHRSVVEVGSEQPIRRQSLPIGGSRPLGRVVLLIRFNAVQADYSARTRADKAFSAAVKPFTGCRTAA
jgi:hypothetical protein